MLHRRMLVLLSTILFVKNLQGLKIYKYGSVRIPYMEVIGERGKRHFVYANLLICQKKMSWVQCSFSVLCLRYYLGSHKNSFNGFVSILVVIV